MSTHIVHFIPNCSSKCVFSFISTAKVSFLQYRQRLWWIIKERISRSGNNYSLIIIYIVGSIHFSNHTYSSLLPVPDYPFLYNLLCRKTILYCKMFHLDNFQQDVLSLLGKRTKNIGFGKYISGLENICKCKQTFIDNLCLHLYVIFLRKALSWC